MATPIGHALAGYAVGRLGAAGGGWPAEGAFLLACMALAWDLDFVPGILQSPQAQNVGSPAS